MGRPKKIVVDYEEDKKDKKPKKQVIIKKEIKNKVCYRCELTKPDTDFYNVNSFAYGSKVCFCKDCVSQIYAKELLRYRAENRKFPEADAMKRICMILDMYYNEKAFASAYRELQKGNSGVNIINIYYRNLNLSQNKDNNYDNTISEEGGLNFGTGSIMTEEDMLSSGIPEEIVRFWGKGFDSEDYIFLQEQYNDWTSRHECNNKAQEEIFKRICFTQLDLYKAQKTKQDTTTLNKTFRELLDTAKLQPKQNKNETVADNQTFGTLIDKWETTRPIPEVEEDLKDVDHIGKYLNIFFKGHLSKMMGIKNISSKSYDEFMKKYSVSKPEYNSDEDSEALFDVIFGSDLDE